MHNQFHYQNSPSYTKGFTLVELSIVLVIIGLIVGGVAGGQSLIASARLNKVVQELGQYQTAIRTFEMQYDSKPGDFRDAEVYWGTDDLGCPFGKGSSGTCSGSGDGTVSAAEGIRAWNHMASAEIIPGSYSGWISNTPAEFKAAFPVSPTGGCYTYYSYSSVHSIILAGVHITQFGGVFPDGALLTPAETQSLDKKMDDGVANTGVFMAQDGADVTAGDCFSGATYTLSNTSLACYIQFTLE